ncbi:hypothetical protein CALVIDRAFT_315781 [Calocera viscosa TUFC12733]|uniref:Uncharacterized protein n=1 Tax=Calocera viscosa (strain TUFC12733) TaxID=1330018 RepID=A0A167I1A9_CALVF|nr:hypothetical protein CALVIDRAFT_315781 [Calocera viscosa TUFC12733]
MVPTAAPNAVQPHIFLYPDDDSHMQRFHNTIRHRRLPENNFNTLCQEIHFLLADQVVRGENGAVYYLCRRCGGSYGQNAGQLWNMHPCGVLRVTLLRRIGNGQPYLPDSATALASLRERAYRLRIVGAWLLWDLVSEHVIELYLQFQTHTTVNLRLLLDRNLISPRVLNAAPDREAMLRAVIDEEGSE